MAIKNLHEDVKKSVNEFKNTVYKNHTRNFAKSFCNGDNLIRYLIINELVATKSYLTNNTDGY